MKNLILILFILFSLSLFAQEPSAEAYRNGNGAWTVEGLKEQWKKIPEDLQKEVATWERMSNIQIDRYEINEGLSKKVRCKEGGEYIIYFYVQDWSDIVIACLYSSEDSEFIKSGFMTNIEKIGKRLSAIPISLYEIEELTDSVNKLGLASTFNYKG